MPAPLSFDALKAAVERGEIDTVLTCIVDMQGRLMGKRFHAQNFVEHAWEETHCCNYLLATDMEMYTVEGYAATGWSAGYGDYVMKPDLDTLRPVPWLPGTAMVMCDVLDHHSHAPVPHSPRALLRRQIERLDALGYRALMATELEFFIFEQGFDELRKTGFRDLTPISGYNQDYHILQTTKEEAVMRPLRNHLAAAGVPVENTKGEAEIGQEELNIRYAAPMDCADHHSIAKQAAKEIGWQQGRAVSFLAKWHHERVGSSAHVHQSLIGADGGSVFYEPGAPHGMSGVMRAYLAGLLSYAPEYTYFLAPYVNSYKRFAEGTFAPTRAVWSVDNRTAAFRLCGEHTPAVRIECRLGGGHQPLPGARRPARRRVTRHRGGLSLDAPVTGDVYGMEDVPSIPHTLRAATETLRNSSMLRKTMGDWVVDHYARAAEVEQEAFDAVVTDWEVARGFERA
jgi:glutamine synthetase